MTEQEDVSHRRTTNFLPRGAVNHLPKKISQVAQIFTKESERKIIDNYSRYKADEFCTVNK